eukprot:TRINITY_DN5755_c0_g1_i7.p1 TRINITY_DN5755_c0_g1~~TRINITY_DN5755_c0_g1_i7.p1  ORF type:complete len:214 (+),score=48.69 TRINITY_DN5755_c0_g1_i7:149-790(+)
MPCDEESSYKDEHKSQASQKKQTASKREFSVYSPHNAQLLEAIKNQLHLESNLEEYKRSFAKQKDFSLLDAYRMLDTTDKCFVTLPEFKDAFKDLGILASPQAIEALYERYNKNGDGKLVYSEFCAMLLPKEVSAVYAAYSKKASEKFVPVLSEKAMGAFKKILKESVELEAAGENVRKTLGTQLDSRTAFQEFDSQGKGYICFDEVRLQILW